MASLTDIKKTLDTALQIYATAEGIRVSWEGISFLPDEGETWLDPHFMPTRPVQRELVGRNTRDRFEFYYQINIVSKAGTGLNAMYTHYAGLQGVFNRGTALNYTNGSGENILVEINRFYSNELQNDTTTSPYMFYPVFVEGRSDILIG
jgi:hypothetical protein